MSTEMRNVTLYGLVDLTSLCKEEKQNYNRIWCHLSDINHHFCTQMRLNSISYYDSLSRLADLETKEDLFHLKFIFHNSATESYTN